MSKALGIDIYTDIFITYFFSKYDCKKLEEVFENEFIIGLKYFQTNTLKEVKKQIPSIRKNLLDLSSNKFKNFYWYLFTFNSTKILSFEVVEIYFNNLFLKKYLIVQFFLQFLKRKFYYPLIIDRFYEYYYDLKKIPKKKNKKIIIKIFSWTLIF